MHLLRRPPGPEAKREVPADFDVVAGQYDRLTGANPGYGAALADSARLLGLAAPGTGLRLADLCCGTGASTAALAGRYPDAEIVGLDASGEMLARARAKPWPAGIRFVAGDAMDPPAAGVTGPFDGLLMAYGIRNLPDPDAGLRAVYDLLAPGAPVCFLEYSVAGNLRAQATFTAVAWTIIIPGGLITSRHTRLYRYLWRSVLAFDSVDAFEQRLGRAGFTDVRTEPVAGWQRGILHHFLARRPETP